MTETTTTRPLAWAKTNTTNALENFEMNNLNPLLARVMQQSDDLVIVFDYCDARGARSTRVVSPYRFLGDTHFLGLCLSREEPRQFQISRCKNVRVDLAMNYVMPVLADQLLAVA